MKRGGRLFVVSILSFALLLVTSVGIISPNVRAVEGDESTTEQTTNTTDSQSDSEETTDEGGESVEDNEEETCEMGAHGFGWVLCPGQNLITDIFGFFLRFISDSLEWTLLADNSDSIRDVWQDFLNIANVVFVIAFLIMIYSMATSTGLSNYDIKKILPRLIIIAVAVNLSLYLCAALVDLSNIAGQGIYSILISRMTGQGINNLDVNLVATILGAVAAAVAVVFLGGAAVIGLLIIIIAITFRQVALMLLVIVSPVALALYMLPNTEKWGKKWFDYFVSMLLVYPMFMAVWGASQLVSNILSNQGGQASLVPFIVNILSAIAPALAIIPLFKASGGILGSVTKSLQGSSAAKKGSAAVTSAIQRSRPVGSGRRVISNAALTAQNAFSSTPVIGRALRGPAANRLVNANQDYIAEQDKKAMDSANNWVRGLTGGQLSSLAKSGSYKTASGRTVVVADTHKLRAAIAASKDALDAGEWGTAMEWVNRHANALANAGRGSEAAQLRNTFRDTAMASKNMVIPGGTLGGWADTGWMNNQFAARYGQGASKFAARLSPDKVSGMAPAAANELSRAMGAGLAGARDMTNGLSAADRSAMRSDYNKGLQAAVSTSTKAIGDEKLSTKMNDGAKESWGSFNSMGDTITRTESQQQIAERYNIDSIISNYNQSISNYRKASRQFAINHDQAALSRAGQDVINAAKPARDLILSATANPQLRQDLADMSNDDRNNLDTLSRITGGSIPEPMTRW